MSKDRKSLLVVSAVSLGKTNKEKMKKILVILCLFAATLGMKAQEWPKLILAGDYPDPTIMREGDDYYMTHSPFFYAPGFLIWHSRDLVNWEPVCRACPNYEGSAMAPDLLKHEGRYYIYYPTSKGEVYVIWADDIRGPWSKPIQLELKGIDPGHVVGEDGKRYLFTNNGWVAPLSDDGLKVVGENKKVYDGWVYPKQWVTEGNDMWLESPKLIYKDGYYYMTSAEGGTAGPATSHMCLMARSKSIYGPWENSPYNPLVHTYSAKERWWSKGHGTLIDDVNGNWWMVYHAYANSMHTLGRQTLLEPMKYTADGWFAPAPEARPLPADASIMHGFDLNDDFSVPALDLQWTFWKENATSEVSIADGALTMPGKGSTPADARLLLMTPEDPYYETQVAVQVGRGNVAGLMLYYSEKAFAGITSDGKILTVHYDDKHSESIPSKMGCRFMIRLTNRANRLTMQVSRDGEQWTTLARDVDVSEMHHNRHNGFFALRVALLSAGRGNATFRDFRYRNAVPQEKDMSAYLMVFHRDETHGLYMALSRDGYTFTALNGGAPVMAGDTIAYQRGIRDPHIYRGPDGAFYLAMTDLHVFGLRDGYRTTQWERGSEYAWGNNRGLVLMKSWDLINWKRANIRFDELSAAYSEIGCAWAPEITYDDHKGKLMIYYTMRFKNEPNKLYYAYVNDDFDRLESQPQLLFEYPDERTSAIDGDITKVGDKYHLFYVAHEGEGGIRHAVSSRVNGDYAFDARWYDYEPKACEAPHVWKRIGEDKWVLMYDVYSITPHNFGFVETADFVHFDHLGHFNEGVMKTTNFTAPKHGAVVHLTAEEADRLEAYWAEHRRDYVSQASIRQNPVIPGYNADPYIMYSENTKRYYLYPTTDGRENWTSTSFKAYSSADLHHWSEERVVLDLRNVSWAKKNAWAPAIIEKRQHDGSYKYYYYYTAEQQIGVAVADNPVGPFVDSGRALIGKQRPMGMPRGQNIDPDVFTDPASGKTYLYWGNYYMAMCELNDDMVSVKPNTTRILIDNDKYYSEAPHVFYRDGWYYFTWSKNDTRSPEYQVRYVRSKSPVGPIDASKSEVILQKNPAKGIWGTGHHSVICLPGTDEWRIAYHRFAFPHAITMGRRAGFHREVCIDRLEFDDKEHIVPVVPNL